MKSVAWNNTHSNKCPESTGILVSREGVGDTIFNNR